MTLSIQITYAQDCILQDTFLPISEYKQQPSHFGADRGGRWHAGVDLYYSTNPQARVNIPDGCDIRLYTDGTAIWKSDLTGYGQYMFLDCNVGGVPLTLRYAHINQYITSTAQIEQGRTGIEDNRIKDHYHFEVLISQSPGTGTPVDPECVLGRDKTTGGSYSPIAECSGCPTPPGPVNFCTNPDAVAQLIAHSQMCYRGPDKKNPGGKTVDPDRLRGVPNQGTPGTTTGPGDTAPDVYVTDYHYTEPSDDDGFTGDVDELYPPLEEEPPIEPPPPPIPGTPGGPANLTPSPTGDVSSVPLSSCASDTWTAMVNQAVMQTRREDLMNKRFITKSNSVLQYSCFGQDLTDIVTHTNPIFTGSEVWAERDIPNPDADDHPVEGNNRDPETVRIYDKETRETTYGRLHEDRYFMHYLTRDLLSESLTIVVDNTYRSYLNGHFTHEQSGGAGVEPSLCISMANIWKAAKCKNFDEPQVFYTFEDLVSTDPREFPPSMQCGTP